MFFLIILQEGISDFDTSPLYFSRTRGLFRECFPGEKSTTSAVKSTPLGEDGKLFTKIYLLIQEI